MSICFSDGLTNFGDFLDCFFLRVKLSAARRGAFLVFLPLDGARIQGAFRHVSVNVI
jgi:hypothetical protein